MPSKKIPELRHPSTVSTVVYQYRTGLGAVAREFLEEDHARQWYARELEKRPEYAKLLSLFKISTEVTYQPI